MKKNIDIRSIRSHPEVRNLSEDDQDMVMEFATILHKYRRLGAMRVYELIRVALTNWAEYEYYPKQRAIEKKQAKEN